jgi:hypothetical protein
MNVYAQPTERNERLCSLLSAVLHRSIQPAFTRSITNKPRILGLGLGLGAPQSNNKSRNDAKQHLAILFVGDDLDTISALTKDFGTGYVLDVAMVPSNDDGSGIE